MDTVIAVLLRPLTALVLFGLAVLIGTAILRTVPEGRLKRLLSRRYEVVPEVVSPRSRLVSIVIVTVIATWLICVQVLKAVGRLS
jgi:hypothetical protein